MRRTDEAMATAWTDFEKVCEAEAPLKTIVASVACVQACGKPLTEGITRSELVEATLHMIKEEYQATIPPGLQKCAEGRIAHSD